MSDDQSSPGCETFQCHQCDAWIRTPEDSSAPSTTCPACGAELIIPSSDQARKRRVLPWNALAVILSVLVILGIYGVNIRRATSIDDIAVMPPATIDAPETPAAPPEETVEEPSVTEPSVVETTTPELADEPAEELAAIETGETPAEGTEPMDAAELTQIIEPTETAEVTEPTEPTETADVVATLPDTVDPIEVPATQPVEELETPAPAGEVAVIDEEEYLESGWKEDAGELLRQFISATTHEERLVHVLAPERVGGQLAAYFRDTDTAAHEIPIDDFVHVDLSEADRRKGIFLMVHDDEGDGGAAEVSHRTYAFFKRTDGGLKLDWEVFRQTRHAMFSDFIERPQPGVSRVFRVFITEDPSPGPATGDSHRAYYVADLANFNTATRIRVTNESPAGRVLSSVDFAGEDAGKRIMRNATVELRWTDQPENSAIELSKFICWEFLGLGGEPIGD